MLYSECVHTNTLCHGLGLQFGIVNRSSKTCSEIIKKPKKELSPYNF